MEQQARLPMSRPPLFAGIELGGTKIVCLLGSGPEHILDTCRVQTGNPESTLASVESILDAWCLENEIEAIGIGSFGPIGLSPGKSDFGMIGATTKPGWQGTHIYQRFKSRYQVPIGIDTDVNGAALAEGIWGAATGLQSWVYITIGTGVGAGIVVDGKPLRGRGHAEAGHMLVPRSAGDNWPGICSFHGGCVEGLISGPAIKARLGRESIGIDPGNGIWEKVSETLAAMIHNLVVTTVPQRVLIGGGVGTGQVQILPMVRRKLRCSLAGYVAGLENEIETFVMPALLGNNAGPLGSLAVAAQAHALALAV